MTTVPELSQLTSNNSAQLKWLKSFQIWFYKITQKMQGLKNFGKSILPTRTKAIVFSKVRCKIVEFWDGNKIAIDFILCFYIT